MAPSATLTAATLPQVRRLRLHHPQVHHPLLHRHPLLHLLEQVVQPQQRDIGIAADLRVHGQISALVQVMMTSLHQIGINCSRAVMAESMAPLLQAAVLEWMMLVAVA